MRKLIVSACTVPYVAWAPIFPATAKPKKDLDCGIHHSVCYKSCGVIETESDLGDKCRRSCDFDLWKCQKKEAGDGKGNPPQGGSGPKGGPVAKDPTLPSKAGPWSGPPKSGTWHGPMSPPKGIGAPPLDNKWHGPATPLKGIGGSGAIFKSGGAKK